jgi:hypothetical protein
MRYVVENERAVYLQDDPETGFIIYGEIPDEGDATSVNLAEVLLEFATSWDAPGDQSEAQRQSEILGRHIGEAVADRIAQTIPASSGLQRAACALEDILHSLDVPFANQQQTRNKLRYELDQYPLHPTAEVTSTSRAVELAHHTLNAICQSLVSAIDPKLQIQLPGGPNAEHVIRVRAPTSEGR